MNRFFTLEVADIPVITPFWYAIMVLFIFVFIFLSLKFYRLPIFVRLFQGIQLFQLVMLYGWYIWNSIPFSNSLPLYHCRLAMFAILFLKNRSPIKQYFALLGVCGAIFAIGYPVFDPYAFPHITSFSFIVGHYALLVNGLVYLLRYYQPTILNNRSIISYTFIMNALLVGVNLLTGGNYGLLQATPFIMHMPLVVKYLSVSLVLTAALLLVNVIFAKSYAKTRIESSEFVM